MTARRQELLEVRMGDPAAGPVDEDRAPRVRGEREGGEGGREGGRER